MHTCNVGEKGGAHIFRMSSRGWVGEARLEGIGVLSYKLFSTNAYFS